MRKDILIAIGLVDESEDSEVSKHYEPTPYIKELMKLKTVNSINACLFMAKLELMFLRYPSSFCKYTKPCEAQNYLEGQSWREELKMSRDQFETAKNMIVTHHKKKKDYFNSVDKFKGKFYCSYVDIADCSKTHYFRNDELLDLSLLELLTSNS